MRQIPQTSYEYEIKQLVDAFQKGLLDIQFILQKLNLSKLERANELAAMASIIEILKGLNSDSNDWIALHIPEAVTNGIITTLLSLEVVDTVEEAKNIAKFNKLNKQLVKTAIADTQKDILSVTQNIEKRTRIAILQAASEAIRNNMAQGVNGRKTISRDIKQGIVDQLGEKANTAIIDSIGRKWELNRYVDMLTRTKLMNTQIESTINEAVDRGVLYGVISSHGAKDACSKWEGKVVKLVSNAPGDYPTIKEARDSKQVFHPNCKHVITPIRDPEDA